MIMSTFRSTCREAIQRAIAQGQNGGNPILLVVKWDDIEEKYRIVVLAPNISPSDYIVGFSSEDHSVFISNGIENTIDGAVYSATV